MPQKHRGLPIVVGVAFFMEQLDATIIAPAIPDIAAAFQTDPLNLNLTMTVYLMCGVVFIPLGGVLAARWGTRTVFQFAMALFIVSSVFCALSAHLVTLCAARALQGIAAALMVPVGRIAIVRDTPRAELVTALAWMITPAMLGPLLGPPLGGLLTTWWSWHWIFLINVPIGLMVCWGARVYVPQIFLETTGRFDVRSWMLLAVALACAILGLEMLRHGMLAPFGLTAGVLFALALVGYARRSARVNSPLLDFGLLRTATFRTSLVAGSLLRVGYGALPFLLPLMLQLSLGLSALESGLALLATGAVALLTKTQTTWMIRRWGFRRVLMVNGVYCAAALLLCGLCRVEWGLPLIAAVAALAGFVRAIQFNALAAIAYADVPMDKVGPATTLNTMAQQLSITLGISVATLVVAWSGRMGGREAPSPDDFSMAFYVLALIGAAAIPSYVALHPNAGQSLSGHAARG